MKLILASNSPRRKELLKQYGYSFETVKSNFNENSVKNCSPVKTVKALSFNKAYSVYKDLKYKNCIVIGADTIVVLDKKILGKPKDEKDAIKTLKHLSGKKHYVYTGYAIITPNKQIIKVSKTKVYFNNLTNKEIERYVASKLPLDKAGSYGIQDGFNLVKKYKGSYNNIVGLPIEKIDKILKKIKK